MASLEQMRQALGLESFFEWQLDAFQLGLDNIQPQSRNRLCLYYRTGAGKTSTALVMMGLWDQLSVLVVAPPSTHDTWEEQARAIGMEITVISHAKFRQKDYKLKRNTAVIVDEFHLLGGHKGQGWKKMDRLARGLQAPLIIASATPNYNDAERVYCIQHVLDPASCSGGFIEFIYQHCITQHNPFGAEPIVTGFRNFPDAESYLAALPNVAYLPDNVSYSIKDAIILSHSAIGMAEFGFDARAGRIIASQIEGRHRETLFNYIDGYGDLRAGVTTTIDLLCKGQTTLLFAEHARIATAVYEALVKLDYSCGLITGKTSKKEKLATLAAFRAGEIRHLVGTASLGTGTDGLDKVCDKLIIVDDTQDDAFRRQLIGRIMPRGTAIDTSKKQVIRLVSR